MDKEFVIRFLQNYISLDKQWSHACDTRRQYQSELKKLQKKPFHETFSPVISFLPCLIISFLVSSVAILLILFIIEFIQVVRDPYGTGGIEQMYLNLVGLFTGLDAASPEVDDIISRNPISFRIKFALCAGTVLSFIISLIYTIHEAKRIPRDNKTREEEYEKNQTMVPEVSRQCSLAESKEKGIYQQISALKAQRVVPEDYLYPYSAQKLLEYLQKGRADSVKEAINLYEFESAQEDIAEENRRHHREMENHAAIMEEEARRNADASERAAEASQEAAEHAHDAAFWSRASTFIVANEIDKAKRK